MAFSSPVGTKSERSSGIIWPGGWLDATGYLTEYELGFHTGADLNLYYDKDAHRRVSAIGEGIVTYAQLFSTQYWGKIIVIDHGTVDGKPLFSRYGHVEEIVVAVGQKVKTGQKISRVGNAEGLFPYHLHFDISTTDILRSRPWHWPGKDRNAVVANYVDTKAWLQAHIDAVNVPNSDMLYITATLGMRVRTEHSVSASQVGHLPYGEQVSIDDGSRVDQDSYTWGRIVGGIYNGRWMALGTADKSESFLSPNPPSG